MKDQNMPNREEISGRIKRRHFVLMPDGREALLDLGAPEEVIRRLQDIGDKNLEAFVVSEEIKNRPGVQPPSIKAMQRLELVGY
jgi:hypothetical protein